MPGNLAGRFPIICEDFAEGQMVLAKKTHVLASSFHDISVRCKAGRSRFHGERRSLGSVAVLFGHSSQRLTKGFFVVRFMTAACGVFRALIQCSHISDSCHFMSSSFRRRRRFALDSDACSPPHVAAIFFAYCLARSLARRRQAGIRHVHLDCLSREDDAERQACRPFT